MAKLFPAVALVTEFKSGRKWRLFTVLLLHLRYCFSSLHSRYSLIFLSRGAGHGFVYFSVEVLPDPPCFLWSVYWRTVNSLDYAWLLDPGGLPNSWTRCVCAKTYPESISGEMLGSNWLPLYPCFSLEAIQVNRMDVSFNTLAGPRSGWFGGKEGMSSLESMPGYLQQGSGQDLRRPVAYKVSEDI